MTLTSGGYKAYVAEPRTRSLKPTVLVIHENRGLTDHIRDVARRVASRVPRGRAGLPVAVRRNPGQRKCGARRDRQARPRQGHRRCRDDARGTGQVEPRRQGRRGRILLGRRLRQPAGGRGRRHARCRRLLLWPRPQSVGSRQGPGAAADPPRRARRRVAQTLFPWVTALRAAGKTVTYQVYDGANHAFNNDTSAERYNKEAADLAWKRTIRFFNRYLG